MLEWCGIGHTLELERAGQASEVGLVHCTGQGCAGFELGLTCYMSLPSWLPGLVHAAWPLYVFANNLAGEYSLLDPSPFDLPSLSSSILVKKAGVNRPYLGGCWPKAIL
ncbi:unnamed protein product [Prunus armeniaca]